MGTSRPRSNFIQTLLIFAAAYLGLMLVCQPSTKQQSPVNLKAEYEKAQQEKKPTDVIKFGQLYARELRDRASGQEGERQAAALSEARQIELNVAQRLKDQAKQSGNFYEMIQAHTEFSRLHLEARGGRDADVARVAQAEMQAASELGNSIAKTHSNSFIQIGYGMIHALVSVLGGDRAPGFSYWFAALVLAVVVRGLVWPLARRQIFAFKRMALLQPMITELREKYQGQELQTRIMKLYGKYGINPLAGCWPTLVQLPFFLWVFYSMNAYRFEFQKGTFLWVNSAAADRFPGLVAPNLGERDYALVFVYGISMIVTSILSVSDPSTARQSKIIGVVMAVVFSVVMFFWPLPSAFIIYWIGLNVLTTAQTLIMNKQPMPQLVEVSEAQRKRNGFFARMTPSEGPRGPVRTDGEPKAERKTGAPVLHKPKGGKHKKKRRR